MSDDPGFAALEYVGIAERDRAPYPRLPGRAVVFE